MSRPAAGAALLGHPLFHRCGYGANHPMAYPRAGLVFDLIRTCDALAPREYFLAREADTAELAGFHHPDYIGALHDCQSAGRILPGMHARYNIGGLENPWFAELFSGPATAAGASLQGADLAATGRAAFDHDPGILTTSVHMDTGYAYPHTGGRIQDRGPLANHVNLPLPPGGNDTEYAWIVDKLLPRLFSAAAPDVVVLQAGTDGLFADPLGRWDLSGGAIVSAAAAVMARAPMGPAGGPRLLVTGGGSYHPLGQARIGLGLWALLSGRRLAETLPPAAAALLTSTGYNDDEDDPHYPRWFTHRTDRPHPGPLRDTVCRRLECLLAAHPRLAP